MKALIILMMTFFTFTQASFAGVTEEECIFESIHYVASRPNGEKGGVSQQCKQFIFNRSDLSAYRDYGDKDVIIYGYKSAIFAYLGENAALNRNVKFFPSLPTDITIGGEATNIEEIYALDVDFQNSNVVALVKEKDSKEKAVYTFLLRFSGAHVPIMKFKNEQIQTATNIRIDSVNQKIYVIFENEGRAIAYNTTVDDRNTHMTKFKAIINDTIGGENAPFSNIKDITFSKDGKDIYVLDSTENKIYSFQARGVKGRAPNGETLVPGNIDLQIIEFDNSKEKVVGVTSQGKKVKLDGDFVERAPASKSEKIPQDIKKEREE